MLCLWMEHNEDHEAQLLFAQSKQTLVEKNQKQVEFFSENLQKIHFA